MKTAKLYLEASWPCCDLVFLIDLKELGEMTGTGMMHSVLQCCATFGPYVTGKGRRKQMQPPRLVPSSLESYRRRPLAAAYQYLEASAFAGRIFSSNDSEPWWWLPLGDWILDMFDARVANY